MKPGSKTFHLYAGLVLAAMFIVGSLFTGTLPVFAQETISENERCAPDETLSEAERAAYRLSEEYKQCVAKLVAERETTIEARAEELRQRREDLLEQARTRRASTAEATAERRAALSERVQERIRNLAANMSNRMEAAIGRLENIADRIDRRIDKIEDQGVDVSGAQEKLAQARSSLSDAETLLLDIDALVHAAASAETPRETWAGVRQVYLDTKTAILSAHQSLRATLEELKAAVQVTQTGQGVSEVVRQNPEVGSSTLETGEEEQN